MVWQSTDYRGMCLLPFCPFTHTQREPKGDGGAGARTSVKLLLRKRQWQSPSSEDPWHSAISWSRSVRSAPILATRTVPQLCSPREFLVHLCLCLWFCPLWGSSLLIVHSHMWWCGMLYPPLRPECFQSLLPHHRQLGPKGYFKLQRLFRSGSLFHYQYNSLHTQVSDLFASSQFYEQGFFPNPDC
jgi:hypothetical protein